MILFVSGFITGCALILFLNYKMIHGNANR